MKVIDQFYDVKTGKSGRRTIEVPGVITEAEAIELDKASERAAAKAARIAEIREQMLEHFAMGTEPSHELRREYAQLKGK